MKILRPMSAVSSIFILKAINGSVTLSSILGFLSAFILVLYAEALKADSTPSEHLLMLVFPVLFISLIVLLDLNIRMRLVPELRKRLNDN